AEQLLNFVVRDAESKQDVKRLRRAIKRLKALQDVAPTSERFSLLGGAQKRLAKPLPGGADPREAIAQAAESYRQAHEHNVARDAFDHYPVVNWLALAAVLGKLPPGWATLLSDAETGALERFNRDRSSKDAVFDASAAAD